MQSTGILSRPAPEFYFTIPWAVFGASLASTPFGKHVRLYFWFLSTKEWQNTELESVHAEECTKVIARGTRAYGGSVRRFLLSFVVGAFCEFLFWIGFLILMNGFFVHFAKQNLHQKSQSKALFKIWILCQFMTTYLFFDCNADYYSLHIRRTQTGRDSFCFHVVFTLNIAFIVWGRRAMRSVVDRWRWE